MKKLMMLLGLVMIAQPASAMTVDQVQALASNKWVIAGACAVGGYVFQKYAGDYLKKHYFKTRTVSDFNSNDIQSALDSAKFNVYTKELADDTTSNALNFAADIANLKGVSGLGAYALTNTFNFYRSAETVVKDFNTWLNTLTAKKAVITGVYAFAGAATAVLPQIVAKDDVWKQAALRFISRTYLRSKFLQWYTNEEGHDYNKNVADIFDIGLGAYYKA